MTVRRVRWLGILLALLTCPQRLLGQGPAPDGVELFAHLAHNAKLSPIKSIVDLGAYRPEDAVVIVLGDNRILRELDDELGGLPSFVERGGALMIATDRPDQGRLKPFHLSVNGQFVRQIQGAYQGNTDCPLITKGLQSKHPLLKDLTKGLATNNPSFLRRRNAGWQRLAAFEGNCYCRDWEKLGANDGYLWASSDRRRLFLAGHGVFMNGMLYPFDNDNMEFARRCLDWLADGPKGRRSHALILVNGTVLPEFDLPLMPLPGPRLPSEPILNAMLDGLQKDRIFDQILHDAVGRDPLLRGVLLTVTLLLLLLGIRRLMQGRHRLDTTVPLLVGLQNQPAVKALLEERHDALRAARNYWEPAQVLIRQWFHDHEGPPVPLWEAAADPPKIVVTAPPQEAQRLRKQIGVVWRWATAPPQGRLKPQQFLAIMASLEELTVAHRGQRFRFVGLPEPRPSASAAAD